MAETNLAFSKIVATPTPTAWSQAYSAGRLFAAISLQTETITEGEEHLNAQGKELISTLESEFFTLENKDLESIRGAITTTMSKLKPEIKVSLIVCYLSDNVLYLFAVGGAKAVLKRGNKIGTVLIGEEEGELKSASGYVQEEDIIVLQTKQFLRIIPSSTLASSLESSNPEEITETLAPHVHDKAEGGASSIILIYKKGELENIPAVSMQPPSNGETSEAEETIPAEELPEEKTEEAISAEKPAETKTEEEEEIEPIEPLSYERTKLPSEDSASPYLSDQMPRKRKMSLNFSLGFLRKLPTRPSSRLSHSRKIILTIAIILVILIAGTSIFALRNRSTSTNKALFASVYEEAKTKFDEGQNLKDLNAPLAQSSFREAKRILDDNKSKFKEGSEEDQQIQSLLKQINAELSQASTGETAEAKEVDKSESRLLSYEINNSKANYFAENKDNVFFLDGSGVSKIDKENDEKEQVIEKSWKTDGGIGLFGSNVYVLDKGGGILKFVASASAYSETSYFSGDSPDLGEVQAMAIDGSIFVLFNDGKIKKYTRGKEDTFELTGLEKAFSSPTKIFTNEDTDNIYILDSGNSRIVVLDKTGKFIKAYTASVLKSANDIDVNESSKKIFALSGGKVYQIDIK